MEWVVLKGFELHQQVGFCNNGQSILFDTQEAAWGEEFFFSLFLLAARYLLMLPFSYTVPCLYSLGMRKQWALGSVLIMWKGS